MSRLKLPGVRYPRPAGVMEGAIVSVFRVPAESAGQRLDLFLQGDLRRTSRTRTQKIIESSAYDASGKRLKANHRLASEELVFLWRPPWDETPVPTVIPIRFEDEHLMAVDKPANLPVHPTARYHHNTLIKLLQAERPGDFLSLGHRLDRETSGLLFVTKTREGDRALKKQLEDRDDLRKVYLAITWGQPADDEFTIASAIELDMTNKFRVKMRVSPDPHGPGAMASATKCRVIDRVEGYALVECDLLTGRQHQIRVHLASIGCPIVGDKLYGPDESAFGRSADGELTEDDLIMLELPRHALHAHRLELSHPIYKTPLVIEAPLPDDLSEFWKSRKHRK